MGIAYSSRILAGAFGLLLALALIVGLTAPALAVPGVPHRFAGYVYIQGVPAPLGTQISARIDGVEYASTITDGLGRYGYTPDIFTVPADDTDVQGKQGGVNGDTVRFYVYTGGQWQLGGSAIFEQGAFTTSMDLTIGPEPTPTPTPTPMVTPTPYIPWTPPPPPAIYVTPSQGVPGSQVTISGSGFSSYKSIIISLGSYFFPSSPLTQSTGAFTYITTVPSVAPGAQVVQATDDVVHSATTFFNVLPLPTPTSTPAPEPIPTSTQIASISVNPSEGIPGSSISVSGTGFAYNASITVTFSGYSFASTLSSSQGEFWAVGTVPYVSTGSHVIQAYDGTSSAGTFFTVLPIPTAPPIPTPTPTLVTTPAPTSIPTPIPTTTIQASTTSPSPAPTLEPTETLTPVPAPEGDDEQSLTPYIIGGALGGLVIFGTSAGYFWRSRQRARLLNRYRQKLAQWEQEGYDVSGFKGKWFE